MADLTPKFQMLDNDTDLDTFRKHLAAFCHEYVMEIAQPIMLRCRELYEDSALVTLVDLWYEARTKYDERRKQYLVQWGEYDPADEYSTEPFDSYKWEKEKARAYKDALDALLVR